jgi:glycogen debranching enzyme
MAAEVATHMMTARAVEPVAESPFYIPMTGPAARPRRALKHDDTFVVLDSHGDIGASAGGPDGLFNADTRYLARLELLLDDLQPLLLGTNLRDDNSALTVDLTNPDIYRDGRIILQKDMLHIVRTIFLWRGTAYQRIGIQNHGDRPASFDLTLLFDNDFADLFEVRGERRPHRGVGSGKLLGPADVALEYKGLDSRSRTTALHFDPRPTRLAVNVATYHLDLAPRQVSSLFVAASCNKPATFKPARFFRGLLAHRREMRRSTAGATSIETSNNIFNEVLCQSMADLNILMTDTPQGRYPYAGIPWYSTTFGRDGIITALQMLWIDPRVARGVLRRLAFYQAKTVDRRADAEPGKILHEMRGGEMAALREVPFAQYYGSVDATPLFVLLTGMDSSSTGARQNRAWPIKAGRILTTRSFTPTAVSPRVISRSPKCRAMYLPPSSWRRVARRASGRARWRKSWRPRRSGSPNVLRKRSGVKNSAPMRSRSTAPKSRAGCAHRMPGNSCSAAWCAKTAPAWSPPI